jgi:adenine deaminase
MKVEKITPETFAVPVPEGKDTLRVIGVIANQLLTRTDLLPARIAGGQALADPSRDLAKLAVIERHTGSGHVGLGFVAGLGLSRGAIASTVAHDSHNLIVCGLDDADMALAASEAVRLGGGFVVAAGAKCWPGSPCPWPGS